MALKMRLELNHDGIRELLQGPGVGSAVTSAAKSIKDAAGDGFEVGDEWIAGGSSNSLYKGRIARAVYTATEEAREKEAADHVLYQAVMACKS